MNWIKDNFLEIALVINYLITFFLLKIFEKSCRKDSRLVKALIKMNSEKLK